MSYRKDADQRLIADIENKKQLIKEYQVKIKSLQEDNRKKLSQIQKLREEIELIEHSQSNQINDINISYHRLKETNDILETQIKELEETCSQFKSRLTTLQKTHQEQTRSLKQEIQLNKSDYTNKIKNLQQNIDILKSSFNVDDLIEKDKDQLIREANKDKNANIKGILLQNKQLSSELEYQSQQIVLMLQKIQKSSDQILKLKREVDIQKQIEGGLVKRSSAAQNFVKQLNLKCKQLQSENMQLRKKVLEYSNTKPLKIKETFGTSRQEITNIKTELNISNIQNSKLRNEINYLHNKIRLHQTKFQGLASILSQHLENILLNDKSFGIFGNVSEQHSQINLSSLRDKQIIEWKPQQTATVVYLLLSQIKSMISKKNLISLPDLKNPNLSIIDEPSNKEAINLPKISSQYQQMISIQQKRPSRFKGIPLDISTKIVRSQLRNWGVKVGAQKKNKKSLSLYSKNTSFM